LSSFASEPSAVSVADAIAGVFAASAAAVIAEISVGATYPRRAFILTPGRLTFTSM
jgi:hypothetical protein